MTADAPLPAAPDVSLRLVEIFAAMLRAGTTVEAAEQLGVSQPAVSAGLRQLETQLGITLFERAHRRLVPTPEAQILYQEIRPMFGLLQGFSMRARDIRRGVRGRMRIISTPPLGHTLAPRALEAFLKRRADVSIAFDVRRLEHVLSDVQTGAADIGFALSNDAHRGVATQELHRARMVALVDRGSDLAAQAEVTPHDIAGRGFVGLQVESRLGTMLRAAFEQAGLAYQPRVEVRYTSTAEILAGAGLGVAIVDPYTAAMRAPAHMKILPFSVPLPVSAVLITRIGLPRSRLVQDFVAEIQPLFRALIDAPTNDDTDLPCS